MTNMTERSEFEAVSPVQTGIVTREPVGESTTEVVINGVVKPEYSVFDDPFIKKGAIERIRQGPKVPY